MPRSTRPLTVAELRLAKPAERPYKLFDGGGLFLLVNPTGSKLWRWKYRQNGNERQAALGRFPDMSLAEARDARDAARAALKAGHSVRQSDGQGETFRAAWGRLAADADWTAATREKAERRMDLYVLPYIGDRLLSDITQRDVLDVLERTRDRAELTRRLHWRIGEVFASIGRKARNPAADIDPRRLPKVKTTHRAALTDPRDVATLMWRIEEYGGQPTTVAALKLLALTFVRPGELRQAVWSEFDGDTWRIPAERMKMKKEHLVPLSKRAQQIVEQLPMRNEYLFPAIGRQARPISENTLNGALRGMGYSGQQMTAHGFRAMASTLLHEQGFDPMVIELQLAHKTSSPHGEAYNRSARLAERRKMMQAWADYLNELMLERLVT